MARPVDAETLAGPDDAEDGDDRADGEFQGVLYVAVREQAGREASPTTAFIDSQTAKAAQKEALRSIRPATMRARRSSGASATC